MWMSKKGREGSVPRDVSWERERRYPCHRKPRLTRFEVISAPRHVWWTRTFNGEHQIRREYHINSQKGHSQMPLARRIDAYYFSRNNTRVKSKRSGLRIRELLIEDKNSETFTSGPSERPEESLRVVREQYFMPCNGVRIFGRKDEWYNHPCAVWLYLIRAEIVYIQARAPEMRGNLCCTWGYT